ncbi:uncharacterized protein LOC107852831 [Capsicum annuum]|uniref:uncharacterized protein LOC107852831 n=1 Tax=Capsicum annuum TaxID=4072 RepID=UPI001FB10CCD|nr:uncharacterized protein LOC107852831 [Capsicum annuum]
MRHRNRVGILVDEELKWQVVEVMRVSDRLMKIKLVIEGFALHVCSVYALQVVLEEEVKESFWEELDEVVRSVPSLEKIVIAGDFNGHIGVLSGGYDDVHRGFGFGDRNGEGVALLDFAKGDRGLFKNCKVILNEHLSTQHELLVMDLSIKKYKKRRVEEGRPRIKWGCLTLVNALEIGEKMAKTGCGRARGR